ncbi:periplasmic binding protein CbiK [Actinobacillus equuli]|nr:periplasmic binding protein CbiK [Actinobacillus equuli]
MWNADSFKPHAVEYELIPLSKPVADKEMDILVLRHGKPASGIKVGLGEDKPFNLTNENGIAQFTPTAGYNKVWAEFEEKGVVHPDYTERTIEYMLTFEVK